MLLRRHFLVRPPVSSWHDIGVTMQTKTIPQPIIKVDSRAPTVDQEQCIKNAGGIYDLVLMASVRAREIKQLNKHSPHREHQFPAITALQEIQSWDSTKNA